MSSFSTPDRDLGSELRHLQDRMAELASAINDRDAERRQALEREARVSALFETAPQGILMVSNRGKILETNRMAERLFGYSKQELSELTLDSLIPERFRSRHLGHTTDFFAAPGIRPMGSGLDLAARRKDGSEFPVAISLSHLQTKDDLVAVAFVSDMTERVNSERNARQSEATVAALLEAAAQGIVGVDSDGIITVVNAMAEMLFGYSREELLGQTIEVVVPDAFLTGHFKHRNPAKPAPAGGPVVRNLNLTGRRKEGTGISIEISLTYVDTPLGFLAVCLITDVTERKRTEETLLKHAQDLARSNADLQQFAYITSHDLQEPLRTIASFAQMLAVEHKGKLGADSDESIRFIVEGARRMHVLIRDLLLYSRVTNVEIGAFTQVSLCAAVEWSLQNLELAIHEAGAEVRGYKDLPVVPADRIQIVQLFQNLLGNAVKYRSELPLEIAIGAEESGGEWIISVRDNGIGIDSRFHDRIFGLFKRLNRDKAGTGIGLAICKKIVEKHGGRIWVESERGQGSTFFFTINSAVAPLDRRALIAAKDPSGGG